MHTFTIAGLHSRLAKGSASIRSEAFKVVFSEALLKDFDAATRSRSSIDTIVHSPCARLDLSEFGVVKGVSDLGVIIQTCISKENGTASAHEVVIPPLDELHAFLESLIARVGIPKRPTSEFVAMTELIPYLSHAILIVDIRSLIILQEAIQNTTRQSEYQVFRKFSNLLENLRFIWQHHPYTESSYLATNEVFRCVHSLKVTLGLGCEYAPLAEFVPPQVRGFRLDSSHVNKLIHLVLNTVAGKLLGLFKEFSQPQFNGLSVPTPRAHTAKMRMIDAELLRDFICILQSTEQLVFLGGVERLNCLKDRFMELAIKEESVSAESFPCPESPAMVEALNSALELIRCYEDASAKMLEKAGNELLKAVRHVLEKLITILKMRDLESLLAIGLELAEFKRELSSSSPTTL